MTAGKIGVLDYRAGNLRSVETALHHLGADFFISGDPAAFTDINRLIFPGVGEANAAMQALKETGLDRVLHTSFRAGIPILGICLGTQIIFEQSEESNTTCLGLVPGRVVRFPDREGYKIPHMGWNQVTYSQPHPVFKGIPEASSFYFVHSYYPQPANRDCIIGLTDYGFDFASAICYKNLVAMQFHPEKSGEQGLKLLANFLNWHPEGEK